MIKKRPQISFRKFLKFSIIKKIVYIILLILILNHLFPRLYKSSFFKIQKIYLTSEIEIDKNFLLPFFNKSYLEINVGNIASQITKKYPEIDSIVIKKTFPNSVSLTVIKRTPVAIAVNGLLTQNSIEGEASDSVNIKYGFEKKEGQEFLIDIKGSLLEKKEVNLPIIGLDLQNKVPGDSMASPTVLFMLQTLQKLTEKPYWIVSQDEKIVFFNPDGSLVLLDSSKNLAEQLSSLQLITNRFRIEGRKFEYLDLRFQKPVVKFLKE